jgi:hypothetical protein
VHSDGSFVLGSVPANLPSAASCPEGPTRNLGERSASVPDLEFGVICAYQLCGNRPKNVDSRRRGRLFL